MVQLNSHPHCVFSIKAHLVLVTAYRRNVITKTILSDLEDHTRRVFCLSNVEVIEFNGEADHVHILLNMKPNITPAKLVNSIKTVTSRWVRRDHWPHVKKQLQGERFWTKAYYMISVGDVATTEIIKNYIEKQKSPEN